MKKLFGKRFHRIPVALASVLLAVVLIAGAAFAAFPFWPATATATVEEAIVVGCFDTWDNLHPYGSDPNAVWEDTGAHDDGFGTLGDVTVQLGVDPTIAIAAIEGYAGTGFVAGESIVIPVNFRNAGSGELTLGATVTGNGLVAEYIWQENPGPWTTQESGQDMYREFVASGVWTTLDGWEGIIAGYGGKSGSAVVGAQVLFVRISAPGDIVPGVHTLAITFNRS